MPTLRVTFVLAIFVQIGNISTATNPVFTKIFGPNFFACLNFLDQNFFRPNKFWTQNIFGPKKFSDPKFFWIQVFTTQKFCPDPKQGKGFWLQSNLILFTYFNQFRICKGWVMFLIWLFINLLGLLHFWGCLWNLWWLFCCDLVYSDFHAKFQLPT